MVVRRTRHFLRYMITALAVVAAGAVMAPAGAAAETGRVDPVVYRVLDSANPQAAYAALSVGERAVFDRYMMPAKRTSTTTIRPLAGAIAGATDASPGVTGCWRAWADASDQALAGNTLYTFHIVWDWCASGTTVTWVGRTDVWAETSTPGWRVDYARWRQSGVVYNEGRVVGEFLFILGAGGWDIQHAYRCLRGGGRWNGTVWADRGCSIY